MGGITLEQAGEIIPESVSGLSPEWWAQSLRNHHTVNNDQKLAHLAAGAKGDTAGFAALPPTDHPGHNNLMANAGAQGNNNLPAMVDAAMANLTSPPAAMGAAAAGANIPAAANPAPAALSPASPAAADHAAIDMAHANLDTIHQQIISHLHDHLV